MKEVGRHILRIDANTKVMGSAIYIGDMTLPGMLVGKVVTSPGVHGLIQSLDIKSAQELPGVHAVLTAKDIPGDNRLMYAMEDQEYLVSEHVRSVADPVCIIAADDDQIAREAMNHIKIDINHLPVVRTPDEALEHDAPMIHPKGNIAKHVHIEKGDVHRGFREAHIIVEDTYTTQVIEHAYLEPEAAIAYLDEDNVLHVYVCCHSVHQEVLNLSHALDLPKQKIHVAMPAVGGSFGGKDDHLISVYAGLLAIKTERPVKIVWSRSESFLMSFKRHSTSTYLKTGVNKDGRLTAVEARTVYDTGAYAHWGPAIVSFAACQATGPYEVPNVLIDAYAVYTNNIRAGAMRAWGTPQVAFAWEAQMDQLAYELQIHPLTFRYINAVDEGSRGVTGGPLPDGVGLRDTIRKAADLSSITL